MTKGSVSSGPSEAAEYVVAANPLWKRQEAQDYHWCRKTLDDNIKYALHGRYYDLPPTRATVVRIFLSSTFTDMAAERNALMKNVFPKLRTICRDSYGLEFQVVDMRWGVRDDASDDHSASDLCMREVGLCQRLSLGPTFVAFVGQRYGRCPLPRRIPATEMEHLLACMASEVDDFPEEDVQHVRNWYRLDKNACPPEHILQPISAMIHLCNHDQDQPGEETIVASQKGQNAQALWGKVEPRLMATLRRATDVAVNKGVWTPDMARQFFRSVTEEEIVHGLMEDDDPNSHCICFTRSIRDINLDHPKAWRFVDKLGSGETDEESQMLLEDLKNDKIKRRLSSNNIFDFDVVWSDNGGINEEEHADYLTQVCHTFETQMLRLIDEAYQKQKLSADDRLYVEVLEHAQQAIGKVERFHGREDIISSIQEYIESDSNQPLVIYGESGCGKTSIMAKITTQMCKWLGDANDLVIITRFLGTTPDSSSVYSLVVSICEQLCRTTGLEKTLDDIPKDFKDVKDYFLDLLDLIPQHHKVVLVLDSLDQLSQADGAHHLKWLPQKLPPNVKLVLSTLSDEHGILKTLRASKIDDTQYVCVEEMPSATSKAILHAWLHRAGRTLTDEQQQKAEVVLANSARPIYVKLLFDEVVTWKSYHLCDTLHMPLTIRECIDKLFVALETKHGEILVKHAVSFLQASTNGLTESEMEDLLSLDDVVLGDVFQFHMPPIRRLPSILWSRIRNDISEYIVDREADGSKVMSWYHRQFREAAADRYYDDESYTRYGFSRKAGLYSQSKESLECKRNHMEFTLRSLQEYFSGKWGNGKEKPFSYTDQQMKKLSISSPQAAANRHVSEQPSIFGDLRTSSDVISMRLNQRKTSELPSIFQRLQKFAIVTGVQLYDLLFNLEFVIAWIATAPWNCITDLIEFASSECRSVIGMRKQLDDDADEDHTIDLEMELILLRQTLLLSYTTLYRNPYMLGSALCGRLLLYRGRLNGIDHMLEAADHEGLRHCALVAPHQQLDTPGGELMFMINNHMGPVCDTVWMGEDTSLSVSVSRKLVVVNMSQGEVVLDIKPRNMPEKDTFFKVRGCKDCTIWASLRDHPMLYNFDLMTGDVLRLINLTEHGAAEGFAIEDIVSCPAENEYSNGATSIVVWSRRHPHIFVVQENKVTWVDSNVDLKPPAMVGCMRTDDNIGLLVVVRLDLLVEVYRSPTEDKKTMLLLWRFQLPQNGVANKISLDKMRLVIGYDTGTLVVYPIYSLFKQGLVKLLGNDEKFESRNTSALESLFHDTCQIISSATETGCGLTECESQVLRKLPLKQWADGSPPVIVIGTGCSDPDIITCNIAGSITAFSIHERFFVFGSEVLLLACTPQMLIALVTNQDQNEPRTIFKVKRAYTDALFTRKMRFIIAYQGGSVDIFKVKRRAKRISLLVSLEAHAQPISKVLTTELDLLFLTSSFDGTLKLWNLDKCGEHKYLIPSFDRSQAVIERIEPVASNSGRHLCVTSSTQSSSIELWDVMSGKLVRSISHPERFKLADFCLAPNLDALLAVDELGSLLYWTIHDALELTSQETARPLKRARLAAGPLTREDILLMQAYGKNLDAVVVVTNAGQLITISVDGSHGERRTRQVSEKDLMFKCTDLKMLGAGKLSEAILQAPDTLQLLSSDRRVLFQYSMSRETLSTPKQVASLFAGVGHVDLDGMRLHGLPHATLLNSYAHLVMMKDNVEDIRTVASKGPLTLVCTAHEGDDMAFVESGQIVNVVSPADHRTHEAPSTITHMAMTPDGQYLVYVYAEKHVRLLRLRDMRVIAWYTMSDIIHALQVSHNSWFVLLGTADRRLFVLLIADVEETEHSERIQAVRAYNPALPKEHVRALLGEVMQTELNSSDELSSDEPGSDDQNPEAGEEKGSSSAQVFEMAEHAWNPSIITRPRSGSRAKTDDLGLKADSESSSESEEDDMPRGKRLNRRRPNNDTSSRKIPAPRPSKGQTSIGTSSVDVIQTELISSGTPIGSTDNVSLVTTTRMCTML